ncbi:MAG: 50S ribosomal protein L17 [Ignavibacteriae bacterium HGW-Ignavibacteriae-4]|jgi:large subunit ribosomal protein L17|nr:MAG: 50S ribosomal protein L17 [Ignavibacteriae bacterium HGW-Ignavibacteriae-4]
MRHLKSGKKLNRTASHRKATLQSLASNLIEHKRIKTTTAKAKALRPYAEKLISKARHALVNEQNGSLPDGQTIDIHTRRIVARELKRKDVLQELFDSIAPVVADREGGYTRIIKLGTRRGDSAEVALIELVDWSNPQDGAAEKPKKKKATNAKASTPKVAPAVTEIAKEEKVAEPVAEEETVDTVEAIPEVTETTDEVVEETPEATETTEEVEEEPTAEESTDSEEEKKD